MKHKSVLGVASQLLFGIFVFIMVAPLIQTTHGLDSFKVLNAADQVHDKDQDVPTSQHYFSETFEDDPFSVNPWTWEKHIHSVHNIKPVAPYDRVDMPWELTLSGSTQGGSPGMQAPNVRILLPPDYVSRYSNPRTFPAEQPLRDSHSHPFPIKNHEVVPYMDRLRKPTRGGEILRRDQHYPLTTPGFGLEAHTSSMDSVPRNVGRYLAQAYDREEEYKRYEVVHDMFERVDANQDGSISVDEFNAEVKDRQGKNDNETQELWNTVAKSPQTMTQSEFERLAATGFDLGNEILVKNNITMILQPKGTANLGQWGGIAICPQGEYVIAGRIKALQTSNNHDNTAMNSFGMKCASGTEIATIGGPNGTWSEWLSCPENQSVYGFRVRNQIYQHVQDNSGVNNVVLYCRASSNSSDNSWSLHFKSPDLQTAWTTPASANTTTTNATVGTAGGWSNLLSCGQSSHVCGAQARLSSVNGSVDNIGLTDLRLLCCRRQE